MTSLRLKREIQETAWLLGRLARKLAYCAIPIPAHLWISRIRGNVITTLCGVPTRVRRNLDSVAGSFDRAERKRIACDYWKFHQSSYLWRVLPYLPGFERSSRWPVTGLEHLENALEKGKGVILLTAHLGFPHLIPDLLALRGYQIRQLVAELDRLDKRKGINTWLEQSSAWKRSLHRKGQLFSESIRPQDLVASLDIRPILKALTANEILMIAGDGLRATEFRIFRILEKDYPIPTGYAKIAILTNAIVLPTFVVPEGGEIRTTIHPPLQIDPEVDIEANLQGYVHILNDQLQHTPHLWMRWNRPDWFEQALKWKEEGKTDPFGLTPPRLNRPKQSSFGRSRPSESIHDPAH